MNLSLKKEKSRLKKHKRTIDYDVKFNSENQLSQAAERLCIPDLDVVNWFVPKYWNEELWDKMASKPYKERLIIAGVLIAAEIDRLQFEK